MDAGGTDKFGVAWRSPNSPPHNQYPPTQRWRGPPQQNDPSIADHQPLPRQCAVVPPSLSSPAPFAAVPPKCQFGPTRPPITSEQTPAPYVHYAEPNSEHFANGIPSNSHYPLNSEHQFHCKSPPMVPKRSHFDQSHFDQSQLGRQRCVVPSMAGAWHWPSESSSSFVPLHQHHQQSWPSHLQEMPFSSPPPAANSSPMAPLSSAPSTYPKRSNQSNKPMQHRSFTPQQKVQHWNLFGAGQIARDSGVHSMSQSTANSVMSSVHHPLSCISTISSLPDELSSLPDHPYFQHIPNGLRHEDPEKIREVLPELIPLINDDSEEVVLRALNIINGIAKKDKNRAAVEMPLIGEQKVVEALLRTMKRHRNNKKVISYALRTLHFISDNEHSGRDLFARTIDANGTGCLEELVRSIAIPEHSCFKYAFLVLHNLISEQRLERRVVAYLCEMRALTQMLGWLEDKNEKFLNIVTDIMQKVITKNSEQMTFFIGMNGHQKLIGLIANCRQEALLWRVTKLMDKIVQMDAERMVGAGLLEALQRHLDHPSQRLLRQVLSCVRSVSHVPTADRTVQPLLQKLLQLLGTSDIRLKENCVDILANLCANNSQNKSFLVENGAVPSMFQLLYELDSVRSGGGEQPTGDDPFQRQLEGIQETALTLLKSLCSGQNDDARLTMAKQQILLSDEHRRILLEKLREWHFGLLRRALLLLLQLANSDVPLLSQLRFFVTFSPPFAHFSADSPPVEHCSFVSQIVLLLHQFINMLPDSAELCRHCLDILLAMCRDRLLLEGIYSELRSRRVAEGQGAPPALIPQVLLCFSDQLAPSAICLLSELARIPEVLQMICRHSKTIEMLRRWANNELEHGQDAKQQHQRMEAVQKASQLLQLIGLGDLRSIGRGAAADKQRKAAQCSALVPLREELSAMAVQNDFSPMDFLSAPTPPIPSGDDSLQVSPHQTVSSHSDCHRIQQTQLEEHSTNKEQLAHFGAFEEMQDLSLSGDDFTDEFGLFVSAFCPNSSSNWTQNCNKQ
ncbi:hypothetical protein niasHT_026307 [Heterodera trifolii]|uniref:Uncharacterized protein n=1 Tax=Heterodera trifolii TaxID=157864 RepID=A0ABD2JV79_9BILA